jgi:hypothetical protein
VVAGRDAERLQRGGTSGGSQIWSVGSTGVENAPLNLSGMTNVDSVPDWGVLPKPIGLPAPVIGETVNATPVKGTVLVALPAVQRGKATVSRRKFVRLEQAQQVPVGSVFDTKRGTVRLQTAANTSSTATQTGTFNGGLFQTRQSKTNPLTELRLTGGGLNACSKLPRGGAASARRRGRRLFSSVRGRFRTRGRNSAATVRGTKWLTTDTCSGTLTVVRQGVVVVRDFTKRRTVVVRKGNRYFARAPRRR